MKKSTPGTLDRADYKILAELDLNSRQPASRIARKLKLSRNIVDYRIKKLVSEGFIRSFTAFSDPCKFGLTSWKIYLQLKGMPAETEKKMYEFLWGHPKVWWVVKCLGAYDILYSVLAEDFYEFNKVLYQFHHLFGDYIYKEDINNHLEPIYFSRGYFKGEESVKLCGPFMKLPEKEKVDDVDIGVMRLLGQNARMPSTELASRLGATPRVINYRIKELEKRKMIVFYRLSIIPESFGMEFYKGLIYLKNTEEKNLGKLIEYCRSNPYINECVKSVGPWQFEIELEAHGLPHFGSIAEGLKRALPDLVLRIEPLLLYEEKKAEFNFLRYQHEGKSGRASDSPLADSPRFLRKRA